MVKKFLWRDRHGRARVRIKGKTFPLRDERGVWHEPDTPEGDQIYWEILAGKRHEPSGSWKRLIESYRDSPRYSKLKPRTRQDYERVLLYILEKAGAKDASRTRRRDVIDAQQANRERVRFANYIPQVMSVLFEHAIDLGWMSENPAKGVRALPVPDSKRQEHVPWPDHAVSLWRKEAKSLPRLVFELGVGSVQRPGDWPKFTWNDYDGDSLRIRQGKTGKHLWLPCTRELKAALDAAPRHGIFILSRPDGSPLPYRRMAQIMRDERKRLGLLDHDLHALRYRGVMELALAGCDDEEIASYSGHSSKDMIRKYAGEARQIMRATAAAAKRSEQNRNRTKT